MVPGGVVVVQALHHAGHRRRGQRLVHGVIGQVTGHFLVDSAERGPVVVPIPGQRRRGRIGLVQPSAGKFLGEPGERCDQ